MHGDTPYEIMFGNYICIVFALGILVIISIAQTLIVYIL